MDPFQLLMQDFSKQLSMPLNLENKDSCKIEFQGKLTVGFQLVQSEDLLIVTSLGKLPPNKLRDDFLRAALQENGRKSIQTGVLSYRQSSDSLVMHITLPMSKTNANDLIAFMPKYLEKGLKWQEALASGAPPTSTQSKPSGMMGLGLR